MSFPRTPLSTVTDRVIEPIPDADLPNNPGIHEVGPTVPDATQRPMLDGGETTLLSTSLHFPSTATAFLGLAPNDHDWLFEMCM